MFDGATPLLKLATISARLQLKERNDKRIEQISKQLKRYLEHKTQRSPRKAKESKKSIVTKSTTKKTDDDLFALPSTSQLDEESSDTEEDDADYEGYDFIGDGNLDKIDLDGPDFQTLPLETKHEILWEMKLAKKGWRKTAREAMPEDSTEFASFQMQRLLQKRKIEQKLDQVRKELNGGDIIEIIGDLDSSSVELVDAKRIMSEVDSHVVLLKKKKHVEPIASPKIFKQRVPSPVVDEAEQVVKEEEAIAANKVLMDLMKRELNKETKVDQNFLDKPEETNVNQNKPEVSQESFIDNSEILIDTSQSDTSKEAQITEISNSEIETKEGNFSNAANTHSIEKSDDQTEVQEIAAETDDIFKDAFVSPEKSVDETIVMELVQKEFSKKVIEEVEIMSSDSEDDFDKVLKSEGLKDEPLTTIILPDLIDDDVPDLIDSDAETVVDSQSSSKNSKNYFTKLKSPSQSHKRSLDANKIIFIESDEEIDSDSETVIGNEKPKRNLNSILKNNSQSDRTAAFVEKVQEKMLSAEEANDLRREMFRRDRQGTVVNDQMVAECQDLLRLFGVPFVVAPAEAEAQCAKLEELGLTDGTITDDSDIFLFGGRTVLRHFFVQEKKVEEFRMEQIEKDLGLKRESLIALAMMTGCDYSTGVTGVGPVLAMEILAEFENEDKFESLKKLKDWWATKREKGDLKGENRIRRQLFRLELEDSFPSRFVYDAFLSPQVDESKEAFSWLTPQLDQLRRLAIQRFNWNLKKVDEILLPVIKKLGERQVCKFTSI